MALTRKQKEKIIGDLRDKIVRQKAMVFAAISGLKVKDLSKLRKEMKGENCELKVAKKTLISLVLKENQIAMNLKLLKGEIAVGFAYNDETKPFKILYDFSKENENLKILGGLMAGAFLDQEKALALAKLPGREELVAQLFFTVKFPLFELSNILPRSLSILKVRS